MELNQKLLQELSDLFLGDLRSSQYYHELSAADQAALEKQLTRDVANGGRPLVPAASADRLANLSNQCKTDLGIDLPPSVPGLLAVVDGFVENGVSLYGVDKDAGEEETVPGLIAQNLALWSTFPESAQKYLFIGDSELWYFAYDIAGSTYVALSRSNLRPVHRFSSIEALVNDMLAQALGHFDEQPEEPDEPAPNIPKPSGTDFSLN
jgi:hypothetical protein